MLNLNKEKERKVSTQDVYDIISFAIQAADDDGFINSFVFERALYEYTVLTVYPDDRDKYSGVIAQNPNDAWDEMLKDGVLDKLFNEYKDDLDFIADSAGTWADEYVEFEHSIHGILNQVQGAIGNINAQTLQDFQKVASNDALKEVTDIADKWGMNNTIEEEKKPVKLVDDDDKDSLFND